MSDQQIPRPEHPRPEFHRGTREGRDFVCLNGTWQFEFDDENVGEQEQWLARDLAGEILVPFAWESHMAWGDEALADNENYFSTNGFMEPENVSLDNYKQAERHETGWYRRTFKVPRRWKGERVWLRFEAVDYFVRAWVNGECICDTESGYTPLEADITDALDLSGENTLVVRVHDPNDHGTQPCGKQWGWYARTSGIWQTVWLEPRPEVHIEKVRFEADNTTGEALCSITLSAPAPEGVALRLAVRMPDGSTFYNTWGPDAGSAGLHETKITVEDPRLWSPDDPFLYHSSVELVQDSMTHDIVNTYFAFREVTIQNLPDKAHQYIHLNGRPIYLLGALDQSFNPWGAYTFRSDDEVRADVEWAKKLGFNFLRIHIKAEEPRFYYWADRLGLLIMSDLPNTGFQDEAGLARARWERTFREVVERDEMHPSIFSWCLFNETWGLGGNDFKQDTDMQAWVEEMYGLAKTLDPTRVIEDNSPCLYDHVKTDLNSWHFYLNDYAKAKAHVQNVVDETKPGSGFNYCPGRTQGREPLINSEYGGISAGMGDMDISWCFHYLTNEMRLHEKIGGYIYTELQDIEWERNGLLNYDRTPKQLGYDPTLVNSLDYIALDAPPCQTVEPGQKLEIPAYASHFSDYVGDSAELSWRLELTDHVGATEEVRLSPGQRVGFPRWAVAPVDPIVVIMPDAPGLATLRVYLKGTDGETLAENWMHFHVTGELPAELTPISVSAFGGETHDVDGVSEAAWVEGAGALSAEIDVPDDAKSARFVAELSSFRPGKGKQTDDDTWPSRVNVSAGEVDLSSIDLDDHPADGRGVLSHHYGFAGRYGWVVAVDVTPEALDALRGGAKLTLSVDDQQPGGLTIYGSRAGRCPSGPFLIVERG